MLYTAKNGHNNNHNRYFIFNLCFFRYLLLTFNLNMKFTHILVPPFEEIDPQEEKKVANDYGKIILFVYVIVKDRL